MYTLNLCLLLVYILTNTMWIFLYCKRILNEYLLHTFIFYIEFHKYLIYVIYFFTLNEEYKYYLLYFGSYTY